MLRVLLIDDEPRVSRALAYALAGRDVQLQAVPDADDVLHAVAETIKHTLGTSGFLGRWTEDRFLAIVPNCADAEMNKTGDAIQKSVNCSEIQWWGDFLSVTVSVGRAMVEAGDNIESLLDRAEELLGLNASQDDERPR